MSPEQNEASSDLPRREFIITKNPGVREIHPGTGEILGHGEEFMLDKSISEFTTAVMKKHRQGDTEAGRAIRRHLANEE